MRTSTVERVQAELDNVVVWPPQRVKVNNVEGFGDDGDVRSALTVLKVPSHARQTATFGRS
jgi:hypothetical protein